MPLITPVTLDEAKGGIKEAYEMAIKNFGLIPKPLEMMSVSPTLFELQLRRIQYLAQHPKLSYPLLAHIRYLVACDLDYPYCTDFNRMVLKKQGLSDEDIGRMEVDPSQSLLESNESAMLAFVVKAVKTPGDVAPEEIQHLRDLGYDDCDMMDALAQGVSMIDHAIMMQVFQMDQTCLAPEM